MERQDCCGLRLTSWIDRSVFELKSHLPQRRLCLSHELFIMFGKSEKRHVLAFFLRWEELLQSKSIFSKHHWRSASLFRVQIYGPEGNLLTHFIGYLFTKHEFFNVTIDSIFELDCNFIESRWNDNISFMMGPSYIRWNIVQKFRLNEPEPSNWCLDRVH